MLKRRIYEDLLHWKNNPDKKTLVIKGARQVGKTYIVDEFARSNYTNYIRINFEETPRMKDIFEDHLDADTIIRNIGALYPNKKIQNNETLLFLDEIQSCPKARVALKFLTMSNKLDVIASGSLLGINYQEVTSFPVGYVEELTLYSLDFEEYLWASGYEDSFIETLKNSLNELTPISTVIHNKLLDLFKEYIVIGGMPNVVSTYMKYKTLDKAYAIQKNIISNYQDDIVKYSLMSDKTKIRACFLSIPKQLSKDYKKFQYSVVKKGGRSKEYEGSLMWLYDAGIINFCYNLSAIEKPLEGNAINDEFKVYMNDTGLLMSMLEEGSQFDILNNHLGIYKGAIYENIIADILTKNNKKLYYYHLKSGLENDFIIHYNQQLTLIEVKSSSNTKAKSFDKTLSEYPSLRGIKLSTNNIKTHERYIELPLYLACFIR